MRKSAAPETIPDVLITASARFTPKTLRNKSVRQKSPSDCEKTRIQGNLTPIPSTLPVYQYLRKFFILVYTNRFSYSMILVIYIDKYSSWLYFYLFGSHV